jgi:hypothetical protein
MSEGERIIENRIESESGREVGKNSLEIENIKKEKKKQIIKYFIVLMMPFNITTILLHIKYLNT